MREELRERNADSSSLHVPILLAITCLRGRPVVTGPCCQILCCAGPRDGTVQYCTRNPRRTATQVNIHPIPTPPPSPSPLSSISTTPSPNHRPRESILAHDGGIQRRITSHRTIPLPPPIVALQTTSAPVRPSSKAEGRSHVGPPAPCVALSRAQSCWR